MGKYALDVDPRKNPNFPKREDHTAGAYISKVRYIWDAWNRARQNHGLVRVDPPARLGIGVTMRPPINKNSNVRPPNTSIPFGEFKGSRVNNEFGSDISSGEVEIINDAIDAAINEGGLIIPDPDSVDGTGSTHISETPTDSEDMPPPVDTRAGGSKRPRTDAGPSTGAATPMEGVAETTAGSGHNSASDGGFDSAQGPITSLPKGGYQAQGGFIKYVKVHRWKSWAIPYVNITTNLIRGGANLVTTPLAQIPWEYMYFYMSPEEFALIPAGSHVESADISVMQTVAQTAYPTGGTEASVATTNHPKVLCIGVDIERKSRGGTNMAVTLGPAMAPTAVAVPLLSTEFPNYQYGTDQTVADGAVVVPGILSKQPFFTNTHFCIYQPNAAQAVTRGFTAAHAPGFEVFANMITEINCNDTTWDEVARMHYNYTYAPIGQPYAPLEIVTDSIAQSVGNKPIAEVRRNIANCTPGGSFISTAAVGPSSVTSIPLVDYNNTAIEKGSHIVHGDNAGKPSRQPSFHIGLRAIEKADPTVNTRRYTEWVIANIEFEITATMIIKLPSYPNRFTKPKYNSTNIENMITGTGFHADPGHITFGLHNSIAL